MTSLAEYVSRMKDKQEMIFYVAGNSREEVIVAYFFQEKSVLFLNETTVTMGKISEPFSILNFIFTGGIFTVCRAFTQERI